MPRSVTRRGMMVVGVKKKADVCSRLRRQQAKATDHILAAVGDGMARAGGMAARRRGGATSAGAGSWRTRGTDVADWAHGRSCALLGR